MLRYLVKNNSGCFCESFFFFGGGDGFNSYTVRLSIDQIVVPNVDGLIQSVEGLHRTNGLTFS